MIGSLPVATSRDALTIWRTAHFELIKDGIRVVQIVQHRSEVVVEGDRFHGAGLHVDIPYLDGQIVPRDYIPTIC